MIRGQSVIGVITARGGSKGLPGKNIRPLCGKPLIAWTIEAGKNASYLDELMVTTDSSEIAEVAKAFGANAPFLRQAHLASDEASSFDAVKHALDFYRDELGRRFDLLALLEPTSPLRESNDIDAAIETLAGHPDAEAVVSVCRAEGLHPAFMAIIDDGGYLAPYDSKRISTLRRQDLADVFFPEGTVYVSRVEAYMTRRTFYHEKTIGYVVPRWKSPEIDDLHDFVMVEALLKHRLDQVSQMPQGKEG